MSNDFLLNGNHLVPPFAVHEDSRLPLPEDLEMAMIYLLSKKGEEKTLFKRNSKKVSYILKCYYSICACPFSKDYNLIIDPLNLYQSKFNYLNQSTFEDFRQLLGNADNLESLKNILKRIPEIFSSPLITKNLEFTGLLCEPLLTDLITYLKSYNGSSNITEKSIQLPKQVFHENFMKTLDDFWLLKSRVEKSLTSVEEVQILLEEKINLHFSRIQDETEGIINEYKFQEDASADIIHKSIDSLKIKRDSEMKMALARFEERKIFFESQMGEYNKLLVAFEKDKEVLDQMIGSEERVGKDQKRISLWKKLLKDIHRRNGLVKKGLKDIKTMIESIEDEKNKESSFIEEGYLQLIELKDRLLKEEKIDRVIEIERIKNESSQLLKITNDSRDHLLSLVNKIKGSINRINMAVSKERVKEKPILIYIPFYLVCYENIKNEKRYVAFAPGFFQKKDDGFLDLDHGGILFKPYSNLLKEMIEKKFIEKVNDDLALESEITLRGREYNILSSINHRKKIKEGLHFLSSDLLKQKDVLKIEDSLECFPDY